MVALIFNIFLFTTFPSKSPNYGYFSQEYPKSNREKIINIVSRLNNQERPQQILNNLRMAKLITSPIEELDHLTSLFEIINGYKKA